MDEAVTVQSLNIQVNAKTDNAVSAFSNLSKTIQEVCAKVEASFSVFTNISEVLKNIGAKTISSEIRAMSKAMDASVESMGRFNGALMETTQIVATSVGMMNDLGISFDTFANAPSEAAPTYEQLNTVIESLNANTELLEKHLADSAKQTNAFSTASASAANSASKIAKETHRLSTSATTASVGLGKLVSSLKRIAMYRFLRTIIKNVSQAIREGLTNLKEYSETVGTAFAPAVDELKQHVLMLKNAFATALRPILEAIIPVVIRLCDWFSKLADFVAQVFSVLTGKVDANGRYTKAVLGDLQKSNKEAKALRRTLLGFDEINRLDAEPSSGGETTSGGLMFEQAEVSEEAKKWAERLKEIWAVIKEITDGVSNFIKENPWILKLAGIILAAVAAFKFLKKYIFPVFSAVSKFFTKMGGWLLVVVAIIAAFALWGDKIKEWCDNAKLKVNEFFDNLKEKYPEYAELIESVQGLATFVLDTVGLLADAIYNFAHGDFEGAMDDIMGIIQNILDNPIFAAILAFLVPVGKILLSILTTTLKPILTLLWNIAKKVFPVLFNVIKHFFSKIGVGGAAVLAVIAIFAIWGDKVKEFCDKASSFVSDFFDGLKGGGSMLADSVADLIGDILSGIIDLVGTIAELVYALFHGDFEAVAELLLKLVFNVADIILRIILNLINIILGFVEDVVYAIELAVQFIWNKAIVPVVNKIATWVKKAWVNLHNGVVDFKIGFLQVLKFILDKVNESLAKISDKVNKWIEWSNKNLGTNFQPVDFKIDTERIDDKIEELRNTKLDPITEDIQVLSEWKEVTRPDFKINTEQASAALWGLYNLATGTANKLAQIKESITVVSASGHLKKDIELHAAGGYPSVGSMFIAGEAGPEWVGDIGGRTGVMNTEQMASAMYQAVSAALANNPQGGGDIYLDGEVIYRNTVRRNNNHVRSTGRSALLT